MFLDACGHLQLAVLDAPLQLADAVLCPDALLLPAQHPPVTPAVALAENGGEAKERGGPLPQGNAATDRHQRSCID